MSKKLFVEAAKIIKLIENEEDRRHTAAQFASLFKKENSAFDKDKFYLACGI